MSETAVTMSQSDFASHIGCKRSYVTQLKKDGRLVLDDRGRVVVAESLQKIEATRDPSKAAVTARHARARNHPQHDAIPPASEEDSVDETEKTGELIGVSAIEHDFQSARAKREHFAALREELRHRQELQELVAVDEVRLILADVLTTLRTRLEALPGTVVPRLAAQPDEASMVALLADEIEFLLEDAKQQFNQVRAG